MSIWAAAEGAILSLGSAWIEEERAYNFSLYSRHADRVTLLLFGNVHLIAEPWDAAGAYQLGTQFPGPLWHQWNGRFRDDVRRFVRGDRGMAGALMLRLYGSDDLFPDNPHDSRRPYQSINYVTCHDGFTLYDAVAHNEKHNWANGHKNSDGTAENFSWN